MRSLVASILAAIGLVSGLAFVALNGADGATPTPTPPGGGGIPFTTPTRTPAGPKPTLTPSPTPIPRDQPAIGPGAMVVECRAARADAVRTIFLWAPSRSGTQFFDLSIFGDDFAPGTFLSAGPMTPDRYGLVWDGLRQGSTHYARVNTFTDVGWRASSTFAFYTPVCDPSAIDPGPAEDMLVLRDRIDAAIAASGIDTAVAITDLRTGETIDVQGDANRLPGCTINLFALMRVVLDLQQGRYEEAVPGDLIGQTINRSDPITSRRLVRDYIGGGDLGAGMDEVNAFMQSLGMSATLMDHPPAYPHESLYGGIDNRITARDVNRGLRALWDGNVLVPGWRDYMLEKMTLVKPGLNYLIPAGVGSATVSHKNGFLYSEGWADNDVGIVWFERGGQRYGYAISFFTEHVPEKYADIPLGQQISGLAYRWFAARYGTP